MTEPDTAALLALIDAGEERTGMSPEADYLRALVDDRGDGEDGVLRAAIVRILADRDSRYSLAFRVAMEVDR